MHPPPPLFFREIDTQESKHLNFTNGEVPFGHDQCDWNETTLVMYDQEVV